MIDIESTVMVEILKKKSIEQIILVATVTRHDEWYSNIVKYNITRELSGEKKEATKVKKRAS